MLRMVGGTDENSFSANSTLHFEEDLSLFLKHRSEELYSEGRMCLTLFGRIEDAPAKGMAAIMSWLDEALDNLVSKGLLKASDVDSVNLPLYFPTMEEAKVIIQNEGSFDLVQDFVTEISYSNAIGVAQEDTDDKWEKVARAVRAALGPLLASYFGDSVVDELFSTLSEVVARHFYECEYKWISIALSLKKKKKNVV